MPSNQTIRKFYKEAVSREFSRDFLFKVANLKVGKLEIDEKDLTYVKAAKLPERTLANIDVKYMGVSFNLPGVPTYGEAAGYSLTFYCDAKSELHHKFLQESARTFNDGSSTGAYDIANDDSTISLMQLDKQLEPVRYFQLIGASIRKVGGIEYNIAEGTGAPVTFEVSFGYHYFTVTNPADPKRGDGPINTPLFNTINKSASDTPNALGV